MTCSFPNIVSIGGLTARVSCLAVVLNHDTSHCYVFSSETFLRYPIFLPSSPNTQQIGRYPVCSHAGIACHAVNRGTVPDRDGQTVPSLTLILSTLTCILTRSLGFELPPGNSPIPP